jgi:hypothetical protein
MRTAVKGRQRIRLIARALALALGIASAAGPAWALVGADTGAEWIQATSQQKVGVANILSREVGGDPWALYQCLDKLFTPNSPEVRLTILEGAKKCRAEQK